MHHSLTIEQTFQKLDTRPSVLLGETVDAMVIGIIVILNAIVGFYQEFNAEKNTSPGTR